MLHIHNYYYNNNIIITATPPETFTMVVNEVYGNINQCDMSDNEAYNKKF